MQRDTRPIVACCNGSPGRCLISRHTQPLGDMDIALAHAECPSVARRMHNRRVMNVAIATWGARISPVLDTAGQLLLVTAQAGREIRRHEIALSATDLPDRVAQIAGLGVNVLICGAVSQVLEGMLVRRGIRVISRVCGDVEEILRYYLAGEAPQDRFGMPGCRRRRRRRAGCRGGRGPSGWPDTA
jgi:predicted Fe-Mo cluster-binding NifX family protein